MTKREIQDDLDQLIQLNALRPGVYVRCAFCGLRNWYHVDDLKQTVRCAGCGHEQVITAREEWSYRLSSLIEMGVIQGQLAVMQALAELAYHSESFFYSPSLELFRPADEEPWHEIDVVALVDGEFIIGEVKEGERPVSKRDFDDLSTIAETLRPQKVVLFLPPANVTKDSINFLKATQERLMPMGIKAEMFALPTF